MTGPGYVTPTVDGVEDFDYLQVGRRVGQGEGSKIQWRPVGGYVEAGITWTWGLEPGTFAFELHPRNPLNDAIRQADIDKNIYQFAASYHGVPFSGRIMKRQQAGRPGSEKFIYSGVCNKKWLQAGYGWVNNFFPPEIQVGLTGKQDIRFGPLDMVAKSYVSSVYTRQGRPVWPGLPIRWPSGWDQPDLADINSLDDLLDMVFDTADQLEIVAMMARFTRLDELFGQAQQQYDAGFSVDLYDGHGTPPEVFRADGISALQGFLDMNGSSFLRLDKLLSSAGQDLIATTANRAGYVFNTARVRDNTRVQFRTDSQGQIADYDMSVIAPEMTRAIIGGKSPSMVNDLIEIGANLAIAALVAVVASIPGLGGAAGLAGLSVGDLFDDIFFAYQVTADNDLEDELGEDGFMEGFADNTAAYSIDSYAIGKTALKERGGTKELTLNTATGGAGGRGISFGADDGTARRFRLGDKVTLWDRGNVVERHVTAVSVSSKPGALMREAVTLGADKRARGAWTRLIGGVQSGAATMRGFANST